jgi:2-dehydro-3-deoxygalactonokinase
VSHAAPALAAVDWGTTQLRLWLLDTEGRVLAERRGDDGLTTARETGFAAVLESHLAALAAPETVPAIACGMVGSRQGWVEAPYIDTPARIDAILKGAVRVPGQPRDISIVPGLAQRLVKASDFMRGEETQLAGAGLPANGRHLVCMPGTHSKWVEVADGTVAGFGTWPTGELFSLLARHSILRHSIGETPSATSADNGCFRQSCTTALAEAGDITARLFSIRAASLLQGLAPADAAATLSGLLIGAEIASAQRRYGRPRGAITLVAAGALGLLYQRAFDLAKLAFRLVDAEQAARAGLFSAARENGMISATGLSA